MSTGAGSHHINFHSTRGAVTACSHQTGLSNACQRRPASAALVGHSHGPPPPDPAWRPPRPPRPLAKASGCLGLRTASQVAALWPQRRAPTPRPSHLPRVTEQVVPAKAPGPPDGSPQHTQLPSTATTCMQSASAGEWGSGTPCQGWPSQPPGRLPHLPPVSTSASPAH